MAPPSTQTRTNLSNALKNLIDAIEHHESWTPPSPNRTLYHVWDFVKRSHYMLSEFDNIRDGKPLQHPDQFRPSPGTGDQAALNVFKDVCSRTMMTSILINDNTGKTALLTGNVGPPVNFGPKCKEMVEALEAATASGSV